VAHAQEYCTRNLQVTADHVTHRYKNLHKYYRLRQPKTQPINQISQFWSRAYKLLVPNRLHPTWFN